MSYEYNVISNVPPEVLHEKIIHLMEMSPDYNFVGSNGNAFSFRHVNSAMKWDSDIDLSLANGSVMFYINAGSTAIVEYLIRLLAKIDICADFQEL